MSSPKAKMKLDGRNLSTSNRNARLRGVFLGFQYPVEIPGVSNLTLLKAD